MVTAAGTVIGAATVIGAVSQVVRAVLPLEVGDLAAAAAVDGANALDPNLFFRRDAEGFHFAVEIAALQAK
jgi:hypothetical protein